MTPTRRTSILGFAPPRGMPDLIPPQARRRAQLVGQVLACLELHGYERVIPPLFELAEVLERGLDHVDRRELLRFVDPESGETALLRPDITPQIARIIASRLADRPAPYRLCYEGVVLRQRQGRARKPREVAQVGVECVGLAANSADAEVAGLCTQACASAGLARGVLEIGHVGVAHAVLTRLDPRARAAVSDPLTRKDAHEVESILVAHRVALRTRRAVLTLTELAGGREVLGRARRAFGRTVEPALGEIGRLLDVLPVRASGLRIAVDLGELSGMSYYTGVSFTVLARGPGAAVAAGGRYDGLLERFGASAPATGFAIDVANLERALACAGTAATGRTHPRVLLRVGDPRDLHVADALRQRSIAAATVDLGSDAALQYARQWGYGFVVQENGAGRWSSTRTEDGESRPLGRTPSRIASAVAELFGSEERQCQ